MKKVLMLMLAAMLSLSMMACGSKDNKKEDAAVASTEETPAEEVAEGEAAVEDATEEAVADTDAAADANADVDVPAEYKEWIPDGATDISLQEMAGVQAYTFTPASDVETTKQWFKDKVAEKGLTEASDGEVSGAWSYVATSADNRSLKSQA